MFSCYCYTAHSLFISSLTHWGVTVKKRLRKCLHLMHWNIKCWGESCPSVGCVALQADKYVIHKGDESHWYMNASFRPNWITLNNNSNSKRGRFSVNCLILFASLEHVSPFFPFSFIVLTNMNSWVSTLRKKWYELIFFFFQWWVALEYKNHSALYDWSELHHRLF